MYSFCLHVYLDIDTYLDGKLLNFCIANIASNLYTSDSLVRYTMCVCGEMKSINWYQVFIIGDKYLNCKSLTTFQFKWQWCCCLFFSPSPVDLWITYNVILWQSWIYMQRNIIMCMSKCKIYGKSVERNMSHENQVETDDILEPLQNKLPFAIFQYGSAYMNAGSHLQFHSCFQVVWSAISTYQFRLWLTYWRLKKNIKVKLEW